MVNQPETIDWLLDSDPAIRWQVMKYLQNQPQVLYDEERDLLTKTGWCAQLLRKQDEDGLWNHSLYNGKWLSTTYSLYLLKIMGLMPGNQQALKGCELLLTQGLYQQQEIRFSRNKSIPDLGVTAIVLSLCCYFGLENDAIGRILSFVISQQTKAGSWLPNSLSEAEKYTFDTTLLVLESFFQFKNRFGYSSIKGLPDSIQRGQEFLIGQELGVHDGKPTKSRWGSFSFPSYWFYDILTALTYFCDEDANRDQRMQESICLLIKRRTADGRWKLGSRHSGKTYFDMETQGKPSRWNTLRALRVLEWWHGD